MIRGAAVLAIGLAIACGPALAQTLTITTTSLPQAEIDVFYDAFINASGGTPPYNWSLMVGTVPPPEMWFTGNGELWGYPRLLGTHTVDIRVWDAVGNNARKILTLTVVPGVLQITTTGLRASMQGQPYSDSIWTTGGTDPLAFTVISGSLPEGITLNSERAGDYEYVGKLSGATLQAGTHTFTVQVTDAANPPQTATQTLEMVVNPALPVSIGSTVLTRAFRDYPYHEQFWFYGGAPPFTVTASGLPQGLTVDMPDPMQSPAVVRGSATEQGSFPVTFTVTDALNSTASKTLNLTVAEMVELASRTLPDVYVGEAYAATLQATGGTPPYTFLAQTFPSGITYNPSTGEVSGVYRGSGGYLAGVWITITDSSSPPITNSAEANFMVRPGHMRITTQNLPAAARGSGYDAALSAEGGAYGYRWYVTDGGLPDGLVLDALTGHIHGAPNETGGFSFEVLAEDLTPRPATDRRFFYLPVRESTGRNNSIGKATPLGSGRYRATISPLGEVGNVVEPDVDVYAITAVRGTTLRVEIYASRIGSPLDSVIEIVDVNGVRLTGCTDPWSGQLIACMNDDIGGLLDSQLRILLAGTGPQVVYVRVADWRGDARPDLFYDIEIEGAAAAPLSLVPIKRERPRSRVP